MTDVPVPPQSTWDKIKESFHRSETILWARLQMLGGVIIAVFATFNFSILMGTPTWKEYLFAGILFTQGIITEYARRRNTTVDPNTGQLLGK